MEEHRTSRDIQKMCSVLKVSRSGYYAWRNHAESRRAQANELLLCEIRKAYDQNRGLYGSPRITRELHSFGISCNRKRVARIMRNHGIMCNSKNETEIQNND